jgi:glycosyltransferase involved in cell wall biosynthesis
MGRVDRHQKGLDRLVERIAGCSLPGWRFVVVGDGPDRDWLDEALARRVPPGRVHRLGWTDAPQDLYRASDVVLLPSRFEGLPLVILEALLHHRPVLASPIEAHADLLPERALASFEDQAAFEAALRAVAEDAETIFAGPFAEAPRWRDLARPRALFADALRTLPTGAHAEAGR